jgi:hypothetical protein
VPREDDDYVPGREVSPFFFSCTCGVIFPRVPVLASRSFNRRPDRMIMRGRVVGGEGDRHGSVTWSSTSSALLTGFRDLKLTERNPCLISRCLLVSRHDVPRTSGEEILPRTGDKFFVIGESSN